MDDRIPKELTPHSVLVQPKLGEGSRGPVFGPEAPLVDVLCEDKIRLVRDATGSQVASSGRVIANLADVGFGVDSIITIWKDTPRERQTKVLSVSVFDHPEFPSTIELYLE